MKLFSVPYYNSITYKSPETGTLGDRILGLHDTVEVVRGIMPKVIDLLEDLYLCVIEQ